MLFAIRGLPPVYASSIILTTGTDNSPVQGTTVRQLLHWLRRRFSNRYPGTRQRYDSGRRTRAQDDFVLPAHSKDAVRLAAVARSLHVQRVRVKVLTGDTLQVIGHGSRHRTARALNEVATQVRKAISRMPGTKLRGVLPFGHALARHQGSALLTGALGLPAGFGVGLGLVVPSRSRMSRGRTRA